MLLKMFVFFFLCFLLLIFFNKRLVFHLVENIFIQK